MTSFFTVGPAILAAIYFLILGLVVGYPLATILEADVRARLLIAPAMGLGLFGVVSVLAFQILPFSPLGIVAVVFTAAIAAAVLRAGVSQPLFHTLAPTGLSFVVSTIALAFVPAFANAPHAIDGGIALGKPVFDHAKVAIIDEIARNGLPTHNPFYQEAGSANLLNYYYLWYLVAATAKSVTGATGWEADVALTGTTAFISLSTLAWAAVALSRKANAAWWVLAIAACATLRIPLALLFGAWMQDHISDEHRLEGWVEQAAWVPQHMLAATLATLAILGVVKLVKAARWAPRAGAIVGVLIAASYDSSIWIGGFGLAAILPLIALLGLARSPREARPAIFGTLAVAASSAGVFTAVFLIRNLSLVGHRTTVRFWTYPVLADVDTIAGRLANEAAYWLLLLAADFGFAYVLTAVWCFTLRGRWRELENLPDSALALAFVLPLLTAQFVVSVIANNDLGWRIVLLAVFAMIIVAAASAARLIGTAMRPWIIALAALFLVPGIASGAYLSLQFGHIVPAPTLKPSDGPFADSVALWRAVRAVTPKDQAVLNNPAAFADMTAWPGNISWALLSDRRSCAAGRQWLRSLAPQLLPADLKALDDRLDRVFAGRGTNDDLLVMKRDYLCATLVVVPSDGLWGSPLLVGNPTYTLVDGTDRWRIYR